MLFAILVRQPPYDRQSSLSALHFARAALEAGHKIQRVFFYEGGVSNASSLIVPPQNEQNVPELWSKLARDFELELVVCIAAAQRRGIVNAEEADRHGLDANNLRPEFIISGLGQLLDACIESDRLVSFG